MEHHYILYGICAGLVIWNVILHSKVNTATLFHGLAGKLKTAGVDLYDLLAKCQKSCGVKATQVPTPPVTPPTAG